MPIYQPAGHVEGNGIRYQWMQDPPNAIWNNTITYTNSGVGGVHIELPPQGGTEMGTPVTTVDQLAAAPAGTTVTVTLTTGDINHWTADGKGGVTKDGATIPAAQFQSAIRNNSVQIIEPVKIGDTFVEDRHYVQIIGAQGEEWVIGKSGTRGAANTLEVRVGQPDPRWRKLNEVLAREVQAAFDLLKKVHEAEQVEARLKEILDHGEVPANESYHVTVKVPGAVSLLLSARQVGATFPEMDDVILDTIDAFDVTYHRVVQVRKRSRWGCACDQITEADIGEPVFEVVGCEPVRAGAESTVHAAA